MSDPFPIWRDTEAVDGHLWGFYRGMKYESCRNCGNIRRHDKKNSPCRGKAQLRQFEKPL